MKLLISITMLLLPVLIGCSEENNTYLVDDCAIEMLEDGQRITCGADSIIIPDLERVVTIHQQCGRDKVIEMDGGMFLAWYSGLGIELMREFTIHKLQTCEVKVRYGVLEVTNE